MDNILFQSKKIAYSTTGKSKIPLVFIHGFCEDSRIWDNFSPHFSEFRVITVDLPGFGASELLEKNSIEDYADVVYAVLKDLDVKNCYFIGHSLGGYVGLAFAKKYGDMLKGLCLFHSHPFADTDEKKIARQKNIEFVQKHGAPMFVKHLIPSLFHPNFAKSNDFLINELIFRANKYTPNAICAALEAMKNRPDYSEVLKNINCPVLYIIGEEDQTVPKEASLKQTHLANINIAHILPKVAHCGMFEAKTKCVKTIKNFVVFCEN